MMSKALKILSFLLIGWFSMTGAATVSAQGKARRQSEKTAERTAQFDQLVQRAADARQADRLDEAIKLYQQAVKQRPAWAEGWWALGAMFYELDRYAEGAQSLQRLTMLEPKLGAAWALLGMCEFRLGKYQAALLHLQRGRSLGVGGNEELSSVALYHEVILLNRFEQFELAYKTLLMLVQPREDQAIIEVFGLTMLRLPYLPVETPPDKREMVVKAGRAAYYGAIQQLEESRREYQELLAAYPNAPGVHYAYGVSLLLENSDGALAEFRRELELSPRHVPARLQIAFEYIKRNRHAEGLKYAEEAVQLDPDSIPARNALGRILTETGDYQRAVKELEVGITLAPESPEMRFALARAYSRAGRKAEADRARAEFMRLDNLRRTRGESGTSTLPANAGKPETKRPSP